MVASGSQQVSEYGTQHDQLHSTLKVTRGTGLRTYSELLPYGFILSTLWFMSVRLYSKFSVYECVIILEILDFSFTSVRI